MIDSIGYNGGVTAKLSIPNSNGRHFKNKGCNALWELLSKAVIGNNISNLLPTHIGIYEERIGGDLYSLTYAPLKIHNREFGIVSNGNMGVTLTATETYTQKKVSTEEIGSTIILRLLSADGHTLAEVADVDDVLKSIHDAILPGIDAIFEWELKFNNMASVEEIPNG